MESEGELGRESEGEGKEVDKVSNEERAEGQASYGAESTGMAGNLQGAKEGRFNIVT